MTTLKLPSAASPDAGKRIALLSVPHLRTFCPSSSFLNSGAGALRVQVMKVSTPNHRRCGALGTQMNLFGRLARVVKSYTDAILGSFEDPEKILEQAVVDMNYDLIKLRQATAQVLVSKKRLENKYEASRQAADNWYNKASLALKKGDEDLAREALKRCKALAENANSLKSQLDHQTSIVDNLVSNTQLLESKLQEAKSKKDSLKARAQSARTATKISEMLSDVDTSSALAAFEKMEEKVSVMESEAEALQHLTSNNLEGQFTLLDSTSVDDDLERLKREFSGNLRQKGRLPPGRLEGRRSEAAYPWPDELRRKSNN